MYAKILKRILDLIVSFLALPFVLIIILIVSPLIYIADKGPIFYNAQRLGRHGKLYNMYKFRTMKVNAADIRNPDGSTFNSEDDPRLTKVGKMLRKTSIDEIPQILNVIIGNMSFIGPRPDLPEHIKYYQEAEIRKLEVLPGITGYNQAYYRNSNEWKDRLVNDVYYVDNLSLIFDLKIFFKTIDSIMNKKGVYISAQAKDTGGVNINEKQ